MMKIHTYEYIQTTHALSDPPKGSDISATPSEVKREWYDEKKKFK
jgi:hypothetical protein